MSALMNEQQVRDSLRRAVYEVIGPLNRAGNSFRTQMQDDNTTYNVTVDRRSGRIVRANPTPASNTGGGGTTIPSRQGG